MVTTVALLGGSEPSGRATLAEALKQAIALQAPDLEVLIDPTPIPTTPSQYGLTLLLAPAPSDGPDGEATDARLRDAMQRAGLAFQVVHGQGADRERQALRAIGNAMGRALVVDDPALAQGRGQWTCDNCSDPDCEHRLFTGLLARP